MAQENDRNRDPRPRGAAAGDDGWALRASERQFQGEFGRMPCRMLVSSLAEGKLSRYLAANDAYCQLIGYTWEELDGHDVLGDIHPEDQGAVEGAIQPLIAGESAGIAVAARLIRKDGEAIVIRLTGSAVTPPAGERYLAAFVEDFTEAGQAKDEIRQLTRELARSRRLETVGQLVGGIGHDFSNLLTVIASYAGLVHEEVSIASATYSMTQWEPVRCDVEQIMEATERAKLLVRHMLAFAQRGPAQPLDVDLGQVMGDVRYVLNELLGEQITVVFQACRDAWPVRVDPAMLEQAILNIAMNAREAMPAGGHLTISIGNVDTSRTDTSRTDRADLQIGKQDADKLAELLPGPYVALRIADTGTGMDPSVAERAFEPFFTTNSSGQAAGLGLTAVQRIAAQAGGRAWLQSEPGSGTTITIALPAAHGVGYEVVSPVIVADRTERPHSSVLVVDDDPQIRAVVHRVLASAGYRVATAASGQDALGLLKDQGIPADLLLTDVVMPGLVGKAFVAQVRELRPRIQVLFMSGYERPADPAREWPDAGMPLIGKPFSRSVLLTTVAGMLTADSSRAPGEQKLRATPADSG